MARTQIGVQDANDQASVLNRALDLYFEDVATFQRQTDGRGRLSQIEPPDLLHHQSLRSSPSQFETTSTIMREQDAAFEESERVDAERERTKTLEARRKMEAEKTALQEASDRQIALEDVMERKRRRVGEYRSSGSGSEWKGNGFNADEQTTTIKVRRSDGRILVERFDSRAPAQLILDLLDLDTVAPSPGGYRLAFACNPSHYIREGVCGSFEDNELRGQMALFMIPTDLA